MKAESLTRVLFVMTVVLTVVIGRDGWSAAIAATLLATCGVCLGLSIASRRVDGRGSRSGPTV